MFVGDVRIATTGDGTVNRVEAGGYGLRKLTVTTGRVGEIIANGDGTSLSTNATNPRVRFAEADDAVRVAALQNGEIDVAVNIPPHLAGIIEKHPKIYLSTAPSIRTIQLMIYTHQMDSEHKPTGPYNGPTADKRVRQALAYAIDADDQAKIMWDHDVSQAQLALSQIHISETTRQAEIS